VRLLARDDAPPKPSVPEGDAEGWKACFEASRPEGDGKVGRRVLRVLPSQPGGRGLEMCVPAAYRLRKPQAGNGERPPPPDLPRTGRLARKRFATNAGISWPHDCGNTATPAKCGGDRSDALRPFARRTALGVTSLHQSSRGPGVWVSGAATHEHPAPGADAGVKWATRSCSGSEERPQAQGVRSFGGFQSFSRDHV